MHYNNANSTDYCFSVVKKCCNNHCSVAITVAIFVATNVFNDQ